MPNIFTKIMDLIEKETDMPLLERDLDKWIKAREDNEEIYHIYMTASNARDL